MEAVSFDAATARIFNRRPGGSRHLAYQDANGSICLWCHSDLARGGVAVSAGAVEWLDGMPGAHFIRLTNAKGGLDVVLAADQVPLGPERSGYHGAYHIVDQRDLAVPDFSPVPF